MERFADQLHMSVTTRIARTVRAEVMGADTTRLLLDRDRGENWTGGWGICQRLGRSLAEEARPTHQNRAVAEDQLARRIQEGSAEDHQRRKS